MTCVHTMGGRVTENNEQRESTKALDGSEKKCHAHGPHPPNTLKGASTVERISTLIHSLDILVAIALGVVRELSHSLEWLATRDFWWSYG